MSICALAINRPLSPQGPPALLRGMVTAGVRDIYAGKLESMERPANAPPNKSVNRTFYSGPTYGGFAIFTSGRATVKRRLPKR